ncbi:MAG: hypothetical protein SF052_16255 [Bacteroidia bacterium]|nr:hypothetical protein [Bacteroidia bacterium]
MNKNAFFNLVILVSSILLMQSCKPEEPVGEEEITTVQLIFNGTETFTWKDGSDPDSIILSPLTNYTVEVKFLNKNKTPAEDITAEIRKEDDEHLVCFEILGELILTNLTIQRTDTDGTYEVGLSSFWQTGAAATGQIALKLRHQPGGIKDGTCTPGDSDVEIVFDLAVR